MRSQGCSSLTKLRGAAASGPTPSSVTCIRSPDLSGPGIRVMSSLGCYTSSTPSRRSQAFVKSHFLTDWGDRAL